MTLLPAPRPPRFVLAETEPLPEGLRRVSLEQFDSAVSALGAAGGFDAGVHETRKAIKRLRAILRLVSSEIGPRAYRVENAILREAGQALAPLRDGMVLVISVERLRRRFEHQLAPETFAELQAALEARHQRRRDHTLDDVRLIPDVITTLRAARARYAAWPVEGGSPGYGRRPIRNSFGAVAPGLGGTYGRGRAEMETAIDQPTPARFHQWRKRVKYLRHQTELLVPLWPDLLTPTAGALDDLGELLGDDHDLAVLVEALAGLPELCPDPRERSLLVGMAQHRRSELERAAATLGARLYAETVPQYLRRIGAYWRAGPPLPVTDS